MLLRQHLAAQLRGGSEGDAEAGEGVVGVHQELNAGAADVIGRAGRPVAW
jgi:hypothetical protein